MRGRCENYYRFKCERVIQDENSSGMERIEVYYFKEQKELTLKYGIPKSSIYLMIKEGDDHSLRKWKNFVISKCKESVFSRVEIDLNGIYL